MENIMLRPIGVGSSDEGSTNFPLFTDTPVGYHIYRRIYRDSTIVDGAPLSYGGPWSFRGFQIYNVVGSISFGIDSGQTSKSQSGSLDLGPYFLGDDLNIIAGTTIDASISLTQSFTSTSTTGTATVTVSNQNLSFGDSVSGHVYDRYYRNYSSGSTSTTTISGNMDSGYVRISKQFKAVNLKPIPLISSSP